MNIAIDILIMIFSAFAVISIVLITVIFFLVRKAELEDQDGPQSNVPVQCGNCEGKPKIIDATDQCSRAFVVICEDCGHCVPFYATTESQAIKEWNDVNT